MPCQERVGHIGTRNKCTRNRITEIHTSTFCVACIIRVRKKSWTKIKKFCGKIKIGKRVLN